MQLFQTRMCYVTAWRVTPLEHCPIKSKCIALKSYCSPWLNNTLRDRIKEKHRLYNLCQENPDFVPLYKQQRNLVSNKIKQAKMQYYNDKFNNNLHDAKSIPGKLLTKYWNQILRGKMIFKLKKMAPNWAIAPKLPMLLMIISHPLLQILLPKSQMLGLTP